VTAVFFLFFLHLALGLLAALLLVPERAGVKFFKLCAAIAAFLMTAGLWLLYRRYGLTGAGASVRWSYAPMFAASLGFLLLTVVYNRAWHFDWAARRALLAASVLAGLLGAVFAAPDLVFGFADLTSAVLLGAATSAMILGHYYLVVLDLPITALRRLTVLLIASLVVRAAAVGLVLAGPHAGFEEARLVATGLWSADGIFVWMRLLFGIAGPLSLSWFIWKTVEIRSTQSATGILYVQLFLVLSGELLAKYLRVAAGFPL
jgi:protein NrfD